MVVGIILLATGVMIDAAIWDSLNNGHCALGDPKPLKAITDPSSDSITFEYQYACADPLLGAAIAGVGLAAVAAGATILAKSRRQSQMANL